ncbi:MAG: PAS domain-containing sensor histidine kinase [Desulfuromonadales bacterium]|nr:PAS domain-containing sensor histidine kinase [Desulfuromonadales bacterium]
MMKKQFLSKIKSASLRAAVIYAFAGGAWILFSDRILLWFIDDPALLSLVQTIKGWFFVGASALLLAWLMRHYIRKVYREGALLDEVISHIPIYVFWKDREARYIDCNQRFASVTGVGSRENIIGKTDYDLEWRKEDAELIRKNDFKVMTSGMSLLDVEETHVQADGVVATFLTSRVPLKGESGEVIGVLAICSDITLRKREEEELRESRDRAQANLDAALDAIIEMDGNGIISGWNATAKEIFGWSAKEAVGRRLFELIIPERFRSKHEKGLGHFLESGEGPILNRRIEVTALHRDGHEFTIKLAVAPIRRRGAYRFIAFIEDITPRKQAEKALLESRKLFRDLVERINDWVWEIDCNAVYTYVSPRVSNLLGYERKEVVGKTPFDLMPESEAKRVKAFFREQKEKAQAFDALENINRHKDGHLVILETSGAPFFDEAGTLLGYRGVNRDITERKRAEEALRENNRMKTEFVQAVAHEFRTPLNSIQGLTEHMLNREDLSDEQRREFLNNIHERSVALGRAVLNILNITRIGKGQDLPLTKESYSVKEIFDQLGPFLETSASRHRMEISFTEEDARLMVDKAKTEQVLENIVSNALKYSDEGSLVQIRGEPDGEFYRISVTDQGIGMTPEQVARVFDKFYRVDAFPTAIAGVGIGMSIVKHIVEAHGGKIRVDSDLHHGTQVSFTLPRDAAAKHEAV